MILNNILDQIKKHQQGDFVFPLYDSHCFSNIPEAILYLFGVRKVSPLSAILNETGISPEKQRKIVLILIDGFGYNQWLTYEKQYEFLERFTRNGVVAPLTSVFPSTTASAITTIHSGLTTQEHGLLEWWMYLEEIGEVIQTLPFRQPDSRVQDQLLSKGIAPSVLFDGKTLYEELKEHGIPSFLLMNNIIKGTAYTTQVNRGGEKVPFTSGPDLMSKLLETLSKAPSPAYINVYWGDIDNYAHDYGVHSQRYLEELTLFFGLLETEFIRKIPGKLAEETIILVTADHGQINVNPEEIIYLNEYPEVEENLRVNPTGSKIIPWGNSRDIFIAVKEGKIDRVFGFLTELLQNQATIVKSDDALKSGLFGHGKLHWQFRNRIGDILIQPRGNSIIWYQRNKAKKFTMLGMHGGLSPDEMLVPFAALKGEQLI